MHTDIPWTEYSSRIPLWDESFRESLELLCGEGAPRWTAFCGDRRTQEEENIINHFAGSLRKAWGTGEAGGAEFLLPWVEARIQDTLWFRKNLSLRDLGDWAVLPTMTRSDLAVALDQIIPESADLTGLVINPTSGTNGQPILCPNHPRAVGCYDAFLEFILEVWGIDWDLAPGRTAAVQVCYQADTLTYATVHARHQGAGFAKVNFHPARWPTPEAQVWFDRVNPQILTGDPWSFFHMKKLGLKAHPKALISTSLKLTQNQRLDWENYFACPVIDLFSLNETGPLGVSLPGEPEVFRQMAPDVFLESDPATGELLVTGGRNPYLPLFRYRTGDRVEMTSGSLPGFVGVSSREMVVWEKADGSPAQPLDIARILRCYPEVLSHKFQPQDRYNLVLTLKAPQIRPEAVQEIGDRLASFWEGHLEAGQAGRHGSYPIPSGQVRVRVIKE